MPPCRLILLTKGALTSWVSSGEVKKDMKMINRGLLIPLRAFGLRSAECIASLSARISPGGLGWASGLSRSSDEDIGSNSGGGGGGIRHIVWSPHFQRQPGYSGLALGETLRLVPDHLGECGGGCRYIRHEFLREVPAVVGENGRSWHRVRGSVATGVFLDAARQPDGATRERVALSKPVVSLLEEEPEIEERTHYRVVNWPLAGLWFVALGAATLSF